ncbi:MAG: hypothetical protein DMF90_14640 [Acidobacteria bacterium]|nr:MAG: hypothetical protein DMF90_14640 [Acidobacteriota bacterium]
MKFSDATAFPVGLAAPNGLPRSVIRSILGVGTPRGLQGRLAAVLAAVVTLIAVARHQLTEIRAVRRVIAATSGWVRVPTTLVVNSSAAATCTTGS